MNRAASTKQTEPASDDYLELVRRFPLRRIRTRADYDRALAIHRNLAGRAEAGRISAGADDYADVLVRMIREYDEEHSSILRGLAAGGRPSPIEMLKFLMAQHGMNTVSLGKLVGGSGQASLVLRGKRELSKANIRRLAEHFHVSPALFF